MYRSSAYNMVCFAFYQVSVCFIPLTCTNDVKGTISDTISDRDIQVIPSHGRCVEPGVLFLRKKLYLLSCPV
jgi:hypothetical protein